MKSDLIAKLTEPLRIGAELEKAKVFALCEDGSLYALEQVRVRPPFTAVKLTRKELAEALAKRPER